MIVRALTRPALERFRDFLGRSRAGSVEEPPWVLLEDPAETTELPVTVEVGDERFGDRRSIGDHLCRMFSSMPSAELERNPGLWAWLSLYWFEQLCPRRKDGRRRPGNDLRHIPEFGRSRYHHLLYGPYHVYRQHGPRVPWCCCQALSRRAATSITRSRPAKTSSPTAASSRPRCCSMSSAAPAGSSAAASRRVPGPGPFAATSMYSSSSTSPSTSMA